MQPHRQRARIILGSTSVLPVSRGANLWALFPRRAPATPALGQGRGYSCGSTQDGSAHAGLCRCVRHTVRCPLGARDGCVALASGTRTRSVCPQRWPCILSRLAHSLVYSKTSENHDWHHGQTMCISRGDDAGRGGTACPPSAAGVHRDWPPGSHRQRGFVLTPTRLYVLLTRDPRLFPLTALLALLALMSAARHLECSHRGNGPAPKSASER